MPEEKQEEKKETRPKTTTLGEYGPQLPCGTVDPVTGQLVKVIDFRTWNLRMERVLGKVKTSCAAESVMAFVAAVLTVMCKQLGGLKPGYVESGGLSMSAADFAKLRVQTSCLGMMDVLYAYIYLRREVMGSEVKVEGHCPHCQKPVTVHGDLDTTTVRYVESLPETYWTYTLQDPLMLRSKEVTHLKLGCPRWHVLEKSKASGIDLGNVKADLILGSVVEAGELGQVALIETELDDMSKRDLEKLAAEIDDRMLGPDMRVEFTCDGCLRKVKLQINWGYEVFFASGRSER